MDALNRLRDGCAVRNIAELAETISAGALRLSSDSIQTIQFAFWLVYMAESDLNESIAESWQLNLLEDTEEEILIEVRKRLNNSFGKEVDPASLEYFSDKIKLYEYFFGKDERTKLFWKLNDIRKDLAHTRIHELKYEGKELTDINVCRKLLCDYFVTSFLPKDWTKSDFYKSLSHEEVKIVESKFTAIHKTVAD